MMSASRSERYAESGFVLVAVLWILAALATLASIYSEYTVNTVTASRVADDRVQAEASIRAGVEMAVFQQLAVPQPVRPSHGAFNLRVGRTSVAVRFRSEAARIDLNAAPADLLTGLFAAVGVDVTHAGPFADRVIGWRTRADVDAVSREAKLYAEKGIRYPPRQAPFDDALELSLLPGLPERLVERVLPFVTVFSGRPGDRCRKRGSDGPLRAAGHDASDPGRRSEGAGERSERRADGSGASRSGEDSAAADRSKAVRAAVAVEFDNGRRVHAEVVFRLKDRGDEPYDLLYWRDDFDGPMQSG